MSYTHLPFTASSTALSNSQMAANSGTPTSRACCENGRPVMTDPHTGQTICSCQYSSALLNYQRLPSLASNLFGAAAAAYSSATPNNSYVSLGTEGSAFYPLGATGGGVRDGADAWRSIAQPTFSYDPTAMGFYPYGASYGGLDLNARRKNATRESTNTLKAWLQEHIKNPYPTKGEKIMLAIITKMTLTQVSTWFANARRRLKKENKMTWSPRNRSEDGDVNSQGEDNDDDDDDDGALNDDEKKLKRTSQNGHEISDDVKEEEIDVETDHPTDLTKTKSMTTDKDKVPGLNALYPEEDCVSPVPSVGEDSRSRLSPVQSRDSDSTFSSEGLTHSDCEHDNQQKPKIWSVTDFLHPNSAKPPLKYDRGGDAGVGSVSGTRNPVTDLSAMMAPPTSITAYNSSLISSFPSSLAYSTSQSYPYSLGSNPGAGKFVPRPAMSRFSPYSSSRPATNDSIYPPPRDFSVVREGE